MKEQIDEPSRKSKFKTSDIILAILFIASLGLTVWAINIYRMTIMDTKYLFGTVVFGTVLGFTIIHFKRLSSFAWYWTLIMSIGIGGGLLYFGLLFLNQRFANAKTLTETFKIIETGNLGRGGKSHCFQPYAIIEFHGTNKQLIFYCDFEKTIKNYSKVTVAYNKGLFGFDVISSKQLEN